MSEPKLTTNTFKNTCGHIVNSKMKFCPECGAEIILPESKIEKYKRLKEELSLLKKENEKLSKEFKNIDNE